MIEYPVPPHVASSALPYSPATKVGNLIFVAGQASTDAQGNIVSDTFENEFRRTIEKLRTILRACGSDLDKVVQVRSYVKDPADVPLYNQLYREYFKPPYPARTTLTGCLPKVLYEIDVVAVAGESA
jgi:2-iminobutanoate/2-iminopropanoate deaminase